MKAHAVSGAQDYQELCTAAKNEECLLSELTKQQQYLRDHSDATDRQHKRHDKPVPEIQPTRDSDPTRFNRGKNLSSNAARDLTTAFVNTMKQCYICDNVGHLQCCFSTAIHFSFSFSTSLSLVIVQGGNLVS